MYWVNTYTKKASSLEVYTINHTNHTWQPTTHNVRLFSIIFSHTLWAEICVRMHWTNLIWYQFLEPGRWHMPCLSGRPHTRRILPKSSGHDTYAQTHRSGLYLYCANTPKKLTPSIIQIMLDNLHHTTWNYSQQGQGHRKQKIMGRWQ